MRRVAGLVSLLTLAVVLVACGGESNDGESTVVPTVTEAPTLVATTIATASGSPSPAASPEPATSASPVASPFATPIATPFASPVAATPVARTTWVLEGTVLLPGSPNEHYVIGGDGCVGLGDYAGVTAGHQVVVKDAAGAIVGLTVLADGGSASECIWTFEVEVPVSSFYTVSLPLLFERSYSDTDIAMIDGRVQITLP